MTASFPLPAVREEAVRVVAALQDGDLPARLIGGLGVAAHDHAEVPPGLLRDFADIDLVVPGKAGRRTAELLTALGYTGNVGFNALHGAKRLLFYDTTNRRQLDVFVGEFAMCHRLGLDDRLDQHPQALSAADLLLTKLQIVELNRKDLLDAVRLLLNHDLTDSAEVAQTAGSIDALSTARITSITRTDWGWHTTLADNLAKVAAGAPGLLAGSQVALVTSRVEGLLAAMATAPKTTRWKARAMVGRRMSWYELPEEVGAAGVAPTTTKEE
ncbi:MAG: hypothetical protein ACR2JG_01195 [Geodermatophilaceae bacterium]